MTVLERQLERVTPHVERIMDTPDSMDILEIIGETLGFIADHPEQVGTYVMGLAFVMYEMGHLRGKSRGNIFERMVVAGD